MNPEPPKQDPILEVKEGVVLDAEGNTLFIPEDAEPFQGANATSQIHVFKGGWGLALLLGVGIPFLLVAGFVFFAAIMAVVIVFWILRTLFFPKRARN